MRGGGGGPVKAATKGRPSQVDGEGGKKREGGSIVGPREGDPFIS